jgi:hypothetical protein
VTKHAINVCRLHKAHQWATCGQLVENLWFSRTTLKQCCFVEEKLLKDIRNRCPNHTKMKATKTEYQHQC